MEILQTDLQKYISTWGFRHSELCFTLIVHAIRTLQHNLTPVASVIINKLNASQQAQMWRRELL